MSYPATSEYTDQQQFADLHELKVHLRRVLEKGRRITGLQIAGQGIYTVLIRHSPSRRRNWRVRAEYICERKASGYLNNADPEPIPRNGGGEEAQREVIRHLTVIMPCARKYVLIRLSYLLGRDDRFGL